MLRRSPVDHISERPEALRYLSRPAWSAGAPAMPEVAEGTGSGIGSIPIRLTIYNSLIPHDRNLDPQQEIEPRRPRRGHVSSEGFCFSSLWTWLRCGSTLQVGGVSSPMGLPQPCASQHTAVLQALGCHQGYCDRAPISVARASSSRGRP